jgi:hypothetical protein
MHREGASEPEFILSRNARGIPKHLVSNEMLQGVWIRLRDRLTAIDGSMSLIEVTVDDAAHFYNMYVGGHTGNLCGKHMPGDRVSILILNLPFVFSNLIASKGKDAHTTGHMIHE